MASDDPFDRYREKPVSTVSRLLSNNGLHVSCNANMDASAATQFWEYRPPVNDIQKIFRMIITIRGSMQFSGSGYGPIAAGLTNGIVVQKVRGTGPTAEVLEEITDPLLPVKVTGHWPAYCFDRHPMENPIGDKFSISRWTFNRIGNPLVLWGKELDAIRLIISDNLEELVEHLFLAQGESISF